ncbi:MAG: hypothetical protein HZT43_15780 [Exiguobacterium profundum]|nr:MAG: hypothetical protein HZT43_15780 [Exiguobacterium profundum]
MDQGDIDISDTSGIDTVRSSVDFVLTAELERLEIIGAVGRVGTGSRFADTLIGGGGDDTLRGSGGNDVMNGGSGMTTTCSMAATAMIGFRAPVGTIR